MAQADLLRSAADAFAARFGAAPDATAFAPGRVNLLGEHTDYNGGLVLPMPLQFGTAVAIGTGPEPGRVEAASAAFDGTASRALTDAARGEWSDYVIGPLGLLLSGRTPEIGVRVMITTDMPVGSGLSSSAALEVATLRAACALLDIDMSPVEIAKLARRAENEFVGVPCGIMDQYSVSVGAAGTAVFLDTRHLVSKVAPLPDTHDFVIIHSGVGHKLSDDGYPQRVRECAQACEILGVQMLSDLGMDDLGRVSALPAPLDGRARHIVTENDRVRRAVDALAAGETALFAQMVIESHISQRDDYTVSVPEVDALVQGALDAGADGARLTGGGFGGSVVALVHKDRTAHFCKDVIGRVPAARVLAIT